MMWGEGERENVWKKIEVLKGKSVKCGELAKKMLVQIWVEKEFTI